MKTTRHQSIRHATHTTPTEFHYHDGRSRRYGHRCTTRCVAGQRPYGTDAVLDAAWPDGRPSRQPSPSRPVMLFGLIPFHPVRFLAILLGIILFAMAACTATVVLEPPPPTATAVNQG
jgi:hypothetical protein